MNSRSNAVSYLYIFIIYYLLIALRLTQKTNMNTHWSRSKNEKRYPSKRTHCQEYFHMLII